METAVVSIVPSGFQFAGVACRIKTTGVEDLALIATDRDATAAGVYTQNVVRAACIEFNQSRTPTNRFRALVINSGNANACTGPKGRLDTEQVAQWVAEKLDIEPHQVLVLSTGVIGVYLPMDRVQSGIENAAQSLAATPQSMLAANRAMMTTDQTLKHAQREFEVQGRSYRIAVMAKGAGMIGPRMGTMLAVVATDAGLAPAIAQRLLDSAVARSFNCISVEGHTSTNDAALLLASGNAEEIADPGQLAEFEAALTDVMIEVAKMIPSDGEGATHLIEITVEGAADHAAADTVARTIASSALVKTAIAGNDPNWGRIVSAAGYSGAKFDPQQLSLSINGREVFHQGQPTEFDEREVSQSLAENHTARLHLALGSGSGRAQHWTSDLTVEYVRINSDYRT